MYEGMESQIGVHVGAIGTVLVLVAPSRDTERSSLDWIEPFDILLETSSGLIGKY
jgi:hypothetical protein